MSHLRRSLHPEPAPLAEHAGARHVFTRHRPAGVEPLIRFGPRLRMGLAIASILAPCLALAANEAATAETPAKHQGSAQVFAGADLNEGQSLIEQHACEACHARNVGGDGSAIYRPSGRINTPAFLRGMVEYCNTELKLQLFPEEVTSIGAVLNRSHYKFD